MRKGTRDRQQQSGKVGMSSANVNVIDFPFLALSCLKRKI